MCTSRIMLLTKAYSKKCKVFETIDRIYSLHRRHTTPKKDIFNLNCHTTRMNRTKIDLFKHPYQVILRGLLQWREKCETLEPNIGFQQLSNFFYQTLEGKFPDEQIVRLLVTADLPEGDGPRTETMWFLHTSGRNTVSSSVSSVQRLTWTLPPCTLSRGLFRPGHFRRGFLFLVFWFCFR